MAQNNHRSSFSITQTSLGSPLQFAPASGTLELDDLINRYVPGHLPIQQKRAQVAVEFFNHVETAPRHPVSRVYQVPAKIRIVTQRQPTSFSSSSESLGSFSSKIETPVSSRSSSTKRPRDESTPPSASSAKRLPGFSIMTKDGVDITEYASRGPKTKEQRDHASLMRKLKACPACKRSKQRCDPSHHNLGLPAAASSTPARKSYPTPSAGSRSSISPQSAFEDSFTRTPSSRPAMIAHTGQRFSPYGTPVASLSPSDFTSQDTLPAAGSALTSVEERRLALLQQQKEIDAELALLNTPQVPCLAQSHSSQYVSYDPFADMPIMSLEDVDPALFQLAELEMDASQLLVGDNFHPFSYAQQPAYISPTMSQAPSANFAQPSTPVQQVAPLATIGGTSQDHFDFSLEQYLQESPGVPGNEYGRSQTTASRQRLHSAISSSDQSVQSLNQFEDFILFPQSPGPQAMGLQSPEQSPQSYPPRNQRLEASIPPQVSHVMSDGESPPRDPHIFVGEALIASRMSSNDQALIRSGMSSNSSSPLSRSQSSLGDSFNSTRMSSSDAEVDYGVALMSDGISSRHPNISRRSLSSNVGDQPAELQARQSVLGGDVYADRQNNNTSNNQELRESANDTLSNRPVELELSFGSGSAANAALSGVNTNHTTLTRLGSSNASRREQEADGLSQPIFRLSDLIEQSEMSRPISRIESRTESRTTLLEQSPTSLTSGVGIYTDLSVTHSVGLRSRECLPTSTFIADNTVTRSSSLIRRQELQPTLPGNSASNNTTNQSIISAFAEIQPVTHVDLVLGESAIQQPTRRRSATQLPHRHSTNATTVTATTSGTCELERQSIQIHTQSSGEQSSDVFIGAFTGSTTSSSSLLQLTAISMMLVVAGANTLFSVFASGLTTDHQALLTTIAVFLALNFLWQTSFNVEYLDFTTGTSADKPSKKTTIASITMMFTGKMRSVLNLQSHVTTSATEESKTAILTHSTPSLTHQLSSSSSSSSPLALISKSIKSLIRNRSSTPTILRSLIL